MTKRTRPHRRAPGVNARATTDTFNSGSKCPIGGHYAQDGQVLKFRKGQILPEANGAPVEWRLIQRGSGQLTRANLDRARAGKPTSVLEKLEKAVDFVEKRPRLMALGLRFMGISPPPPE